MASLPLEIKVTCGSDSRGQEYTNEIIQYFKDRLGRIFTREVHKLQVLDFGALTEDMDQAITDRLRMDHTRAGGQVVFASYAWRGFFEIHRPLVRELILEFFSTYRFANNVLDLDFAVEEIDTDGFRAYWDKSSRVIASKADLKDYWTGISSSGDFLTMVPSYIAIKEPVRRLCHRLIIFTIAGRGQAPEKVTTTDLYYLRSMDEGTINVLYLLAHDYGAEPLGIDYGGPQAVNMDDLIRLRIYKRLLGIPTWVALGPERQQDKAAAKGAHIDPKVAHEGVQANPTPAQAPPDAPAPRSVPQRFQRLEEEVRGLRDSIREQHVAMERLSSDFVGFSILMITRMTQLMD
ncbi:hypothetical protein Tco_0829670 [Tanacetum coccineum]